jgi:hypothetical protein
MMVYLVDCDMDIVFKKMYVILFNDLRSLHTSRVTDLEIGTGSCFASGLIETLEHGA